MRLIGNKTKLLGEIDAFLSDRGVRNGTLIDIFTGTASVARHFKSQGFRVLANDWLSACYTQAVAAVEVSRPPALRNFFPAHREIFSSSEFRNSLKKIGRSRPSRSSELDLDWSAGSDGVGYDMDPSFLRSICQPAGARAAARAQPGAALLPLKLAIHFLNYFVEPEEGLIFRGYCPGGLPGRRYFRDEHGRKIDGVLKILKTDLEAGHLKHAEFHLLLSALIDAADRRANISGTYGAFLKSWQSSTDGELLLVAPGVVGSAVAGHKVYQEDSNRLIRKLAGDVLYIDPPYNRRQYAANYHVLEVMAEHHRIQDLPAYEAQLYGKTGLRPYDDQLSPYCVRKNDSSHNVLDAMRDLILNARVEHILVSYSEEGLLSREDLGAILAEFSGESRFDFENNFREVRYRRFRSDRDRSAGEGAASSRRYRQLQGRKKDEICEWLLYARRK